MLRVLGSPKRLCSGLTRRDSLVVGGLSALGLSLADHLKASEKKPMAGKAKACVLLYLYGAPSQIEMADMKPDAPAEIRGELKPIPSALAGCDVCELLPHTAKIMDRVTVVRSMTHPHPIHGVAFATTAVPDIDVAMELSPHDGKHWPYLGSVVSYLEEQAGRRKAVPDNVALPFPFSSQRKGEVPRAGPYAAFLGSKYNPHFTRFHGTANRPITKTLSPDTLTLNEPYVGIDPDCRFTLGDATRLPADVTVDRLNGRKSLLEQIEDGRRTRVPTADPFRERAYDLIGNEAVRAALDVSKEPPKGRDRYGQTLFGQSCLAARRLVEAGSKFVSVFWDEYGLAGSAWDTHWEHFPRLRNELMPGFDQGYAGLIADLDERGMLDDTLVLVLSEHGRTPKLESARGGGRDHWSRAYSVFLAGGGVARGRVVGKTDKHGGEVTDSPVSPKDVLATTLHLLGYDLETTLTDRLGRPQTLVPTGKVVEAVL